MRSTALLLASLILGAAVAPSQQTQQTQQAPAQAAPKALEPTSAFVNMPDGGKVHFLEAGQGPAILFVPGWTMPAEIWEPQIRHFAKTHRVVAIDPRSQGRSSKTGEGSYAESRANDMSTVIDSLKLSPVLLVCWSLAVDECVSYIGQYGTKHVRGLVLVDGTVATPGKPESVQGLVKFLLDWQKDRRARTESFVRSMYRTPQTDEYIKRITEASLRTPTDSAMVLPLASQVEDRTVVLPRIDKPTLIAGTRSPSLPQYQEMQKKIPGSRLEVFEGAGHALFVDQADRFNKLVEEFDRGLARK